MIHYYTCYSLFHDTSKAHLIRFSGLQVGDLESVMSAKPSLTKVRIRKNSTKLVPTLIIIKII
jgi:hypothetical protein